MLRQERPRRQPIILFPGAPAHRFPQGSPQQQEEEWVRVRGERLRRLIATWMSTDVHRISTPPIGRLARGALSGREAVAYRQAHAGRGGGTASVLWA